MYGGGGGGSGGFRREGCWREGVGGRMLEGEGGWAGEGKMKAWGAVSSNRLLYS